MQLLHNSLHRCVLMTHQPRYVLAQQEHLSVLLSQQTEGTFHERCLTDAPATS